MEVDALLLDVEIRSLRLLLPLPFRADVNLTFKLVSGTLNQLRTGPHASSPTTVCMCS